MKLTDLRRLTIRKNLRIRCQLPNGMECVIDEHGLAQIPGLKSIPDFNIQESIEGVERFRIEPLSGDKPRDARREDLVKLVASIAPGAAAAADHDE
ncbi:MAG: hypothetical protein JST93_12715 [Acidobacteria bacterium]|nr:hypothetical protein [Acidobacteriota bacterium]